MSSELELFTLPDGSKISTGLLLPGIQEKNLALTHPVYGEEFYLENSDIEKLLKGDTYKTFRRLRSPSIINQASLGKCNASATVAAMHNRRALEGMANVVLSDCYIYMNINGGRDGGSQLVHGMEFSQKGVSPRQLEIQGEKVLFPHNVFNKRQVSTQLLAAAETAAKTFQSFEAYRLPSDNFVKFRTALASALARDHQVVMAWHVGNISMNLRAGYVQAGLGPGNHASIFHSGKWVGGNDLVHPDLQNSWGPSKNALYGPVSREGWGEDGFGLCTMEMAYSCARNHVFWVYTGSKINKGSV